MEGFFWPAMLVLLGIVLLVLEMFIPSGGALAVLVAIVFLVAICWGFSESIYVGGTTLLAIAMLVPAFLVMFVYWWPKTPLGRRMVLKRSPEQDTSLDVDDEDERLRSLIGQRGRAKTKMLPSGAVTIAGQTYDAVSEGLPIDPGEPVEVVALRFHRLVVRQVQNDATPRPPTPDEMLSKPIEAFDFEDFGDPLK